MVEIMSHLHKEYVPAFEYSKDVHVPFQEENEQVQKATFYHILFGGDQLTAARAGGPEGLCVTQGHRLLAWMKSSHVLKIGILG